MFRLLDEEEEKEFRQWARENYVVGSPIKRVWHPVVQEEAEAMNLEEGVVLGDPNAPTNEERAALALKSLEVFARESFKCGFEQVSDNEGACLVLGDFLADFMHLCDKLDTDFEEVLRRGYLHYEAEFKKEEIKTDA